MTHSVVSYALRQYALGINRAFAFCANGNTSTTRRRAQSCATCRASPSLSRQLSVRIARVNCYKEERNCYRAAPTLRQVWLESLATMHEAERHYTEAAMCHLHIAALISRQLATSGSFGRRMHLYKCPVGRFTVDWSLLASISANIATEEAPSTSSAPQTGGDVDDDCVYTTEMLTERLEMAAQMLCKVQCTYLVQFKLLMF